MFLDKRLTMYAASLSFYTLLTIVPLLFIIITIATSLESFSGHYTNIQSVLFENLLPGNSKLVVAHLDNFLKNTSKVNIYSSIFLFVSSLLFFRNYTFVANRIFKVKSRNIIKNLSLYLLILTITPIALGFTIYITGYITNLASSSALTSDLNILVYLPYLITWALFFILFKLSANTKVSFRAALNTSLLTSVVFNMSKNAFVYYIFYIKAYTTIYGSLSILLFLFLWIYISWIIFIYGLKLCHLVNGIYKNRKTKDK